MLRKLTPSLFASFLFAASIIFFRPDSSASQTCDDAVLPTSFSHSTLNDWHPHFVDPAALNCPSQQPNVPPCGVHTDWTQLVAPITINQCAADLSYNVTVQVPGRVSVNSQLNPKPGTTASVTGTFGGLYGQLLVDGVLWLDPATTYIDQRTGLPADATDPVLLGKMTVNSGLGGFDKNTPLPPTHFGLENNPGTTMVWTWHVKHLAAGSHTFEVQHQTFGYTMSVTAGSRTTVSSEIYKGSNVVVEPITIHDQ